MAQRRRFEPSKRKHSGRGAAPPMSALPTPLPRSVPKSYGPPFVLLENESKQTFIYQSGAWVAYGRSIVECRGDCQVKVLAQKVNNMLRYEIRPEVEA